MRGVLAGLLLDALISELAREALERAPQRVRLRAAHEQDVDDRRQRRPLLDRIVELELDSDAVLERREANRLAPMDLRVLDVERLTLARVIRDHALEHAPAAAGVRHPL